MTNLRRFTLITLALLVALGSAAQRRGRSYTQMSSYLNDRHSAVDDSISRVSDRYNRQLDSLAANSRSPKTTTTPLDNPYFFPLFAGATLFTPPIQRTIGTIPAAQPSRTKRPKASSFTLTPPELPHLSWAMVEAYATHPELVTMDLSTDYAHPSPSKDNSQANLLLPPEKTTTRQDAAGAANAPVSIKTEKLAEDNVFDLGDFHIHIRRPNFWTFKGSFSSQFMQYYVSDNWYKGGDNHVSMLAALNFEANYDNKRKLTFSNKLETKLGFQTSPTDTYHKFKTNADLLRLTDKLGVKAWHHWDYTVMLQSWTQFYKAYQANTANVSSDFMSPFESVLSAGMDYKLQRKRVNFTATLSPLAANLKYCDRSALVGKYGIEAGKHSKIDLGSTVTVNMTLKFCDQVNWVTRVYAFYDYKSNLKAEWENTINLKVNKYLSTKLFLYPRFDNSVKKKNDDDTYLQFNEYLSVGLDLNF